MLTPLSADFMALCRLQLSLLGQGLNVSQSTLYLAEDWREGSPTSLFPVLRYPENLDASVRELDAQSSFKPLLSLPSPASSLETDHRKNDSLGQDLLGSPSLAPDQTNAQIDSNPALIGGAEIGGAESKTAIANLQAQLSNQVVLPLVHEKFVLGLLAVERANLPWNAWEQAQLEKFAHSLAISCLLDQQNQWFLQEQAHRTQANSLQPRQRDILDNLLHQLKSPVTAIRTFGKLLLKRLKAEDENRRVADRVIHETDHLQELLQQVQQLLNDQGFDHPSLDDPIFQNSKPESMTALFPGSLGSSSPCLTLSQASMPLLPSHPFQSKIELESCLIPDLLALPLASAAAIAQEQQQQLQVEMAEPLPPVWTDPKALREVVTNLLDNALKYTPHTGTISIRIFCDDLGEYSPQAGKAGVAIAISDTGLGIPVEDQPQLFERHYRGQHANSEIPGTGLGLSIARDLMIEMQGNISFWSPVNSGLTIPSPVALRTSMDTGETPQGSTFLVWIPLAQDCTIV